MAIHPSAQGFQRAAGDYDRARPDYPDQAARWLAERLDLHPSRRVLDIAAGTGKLTRLLMATGATVVAVEPVSAMRERLAAALPEVELLDGVAEAIPIEDGWADAVTVGQAFHWFDGDRALNETHRVTRAGGRLAVVYNRRVLEDPLQGALEAVLKPLRGETPTHHGGGWRDTFARTQLWTPVEEVEIEQLQLLDRDGVVARVASTSFIAKLSADRRAEVLGQIRALVDDLAEPIALPYVCELFVWERRP